jgi:N-acetylglucosamine kinase-like BadF-type ATPase
VTRRAAILAVDRGGSKIDAVLLRRDGTLLGGARIPAAVSREDPAQAELEEIRDAANAACADAGIDPGNLPVAELGVFCVAGADFPSDGRRIASSIRRAGLTASLTLRNDTFAVLRAGTDRSWGVSVVCGAGINCSGVSPGGRVARFPAVGELSGDWGGGFDLGRAAMWNAIRAQDGRGPKTKLATLVPQHFGMKRPQQVLEAIYYGRLPWDRLVELAPVMFEAAVSGDAVARGIVDRQADEVATMANTAIKRLRMAELDVEVILGGGIFRNDDPGFFARIDDGIRSVAPAAHIHVLTDPPVIGAALMGLDELGGAAAARRKVRAALTHKWLGAHTRRRPKDTQGPRDRRRSSDG